MIFVLDETRMPGLYWEDLSCRGWKNSGTLPCWIAQGAVSATYLASDLR